VKERSPSKGISERGDGWGGGSLCWVFLMTKFTAMGGGN